MSKKEVIEADEVRNRLRKAMRDFDLDQAGLAGAIGVSPPFLNAVLQGTKEPAGKILGYLGLERVVLYRKVKRKIADRRHAPA